ncbi:hypothetical protein QN277_021236 [Acacia crassicarpa]|uniref:Uncharacterized protein n=1 Tax=Acacia crassicarpa TaxID=499986 RepID=A0AAE1KG29_9FABA|nr:hypothetical protein QN277_021236 [Acacia crassicarpa]
MDISEFMSKGSIVKLMNSTLQASQVDRNVEASAQGKPTNGPEGLNGAVDFQNALDLSKSELLGCFYSLGDQMLYLWNVFLKFHRFTLVSLQF